MTYFGLFGALGLVVEGVFGLWSTKGTLELKTAPSGSYLYTLGPKQVLFIIHA